MSIRLSRVVSLVALAAAFVWTLGTAISPVAAQEAACTQVSAVETPPPPLPNYEQPPVPGPGYLWSPGYWSWDDDEGDYYWVPGTWAQPPRPGLLWTPGYWGWLAGAYIFHPGYWGDRVGFYGGVNYGFGYTGVGYAGGRWDRGAFFYNRAVNNLQGTTIRNVYEQNVVINQTVNNVSYNGGRGGIEARPTAADRAIAKEQHFAPTPLQRRHVEAASQDRSLFHKANNGQPPVVATARPGDLKGPGAVRARPAGEAPAATGVKPATEELRRQQPGRPEAGPGAVEETKRPAETPVQERNKPAVEERRVAPGPERLEPRTAPEAMKPPARDDRPATEPRKPEGTPREQTRSPEPRPEPRAEPAARPEARPEPATRPETRSAPMEAQPRRAPAESRPAGREETPERR